jgi:DNA polymerase-3 subunit gamma/tau
MENYVVSARKYRPQTFDTVVGQHSIVMTLKNAIRTNQVAQAFLFCGSRGVGKTSTARILAKTLNCTNRTPEIEACNECESCLSFNDGGSLNVFELDAASNNSVDDIRSLIDQVRIQPQAGTHKVYIIDEVHMLSTAAFNAFLKTLEEPPKHAIFILATTEKHKIIPTILSRCQIFDFNRIKVNDIAKHLEHIAQKENVTTDADALHLIAMKADGAMRDSLSIFDQIVSFTQGNVTYDAVLQNLNVLDYDYYFKVAEHAENEDIPSALILFNDIMDKGFDGQHFLSGLASHYRNVLVAKDPATVALLELSESLAQRYVEQATAIDAMRILRAIGIVQSAESGFKASKNQRLLVEWTLMQLCSLKQESEKKNA